MHDARMDQSCAQGSDRQVSRACAGVYYEQGMLAEAIASYQEAISREPNFPEAYNNLGNALREANRLEEAMQCYTMCIQLQLRTPANVQAGRPMQVAPQAAAFQQAQRLSVAYNNLGGILKMQVTPLILPDWGGGQYQGWASGNGGRYRAPWVGKFAVWVFCT